MKKMITASLAVCLIGISAFSQNWNMAIKDGMKSTLAITTYTNPLSTDKKFLKEKDVKKDEMIAAYNADVLSGKIAPASNYSMTFSYKKKALRDADEYAIGYNYAGVDYYSYVVYRKDTLFLARNRGPIAIGDKDNPLGYSIQGIQTIPVHLTVGDILPNYEDIGIMFPSSADVTLKKSVFAGYENEHSSYYGYGTDSYTGESGIGNWNVVKSKAVYHNIDVNARQTISVSSHSLQGVNARVTGEESITISGVSYKAFIIESESWTKSNISTSYESADKELNKSQQEADKAILNKTERMLARKSYTNDMGYIVMYSKQWVVPQLGGAVKTVAYDNFGGISTIMTTTSLE